MIAANDHERPPEAHPFRHCPICKVAMQATVNERGVVYRCEDCGAVIAVAKPDRESRAD